MDNKGKGTVGGVFLVAIMVGAFINGYRNEDAKAKQQQKLNQVQKELDREKARRGAEEYEKMEQLRKKGFQP
jgi:hypothetical protein